MDAIPTKVLNSHEFEKDFKRSLWNIETKMIIILNNHICQIILL